MTDAEKLKALLKHFEECESCEECLAESNPILFEAITGIKPEDKWEEE